MRILTLMALLYVLAQVMFLLLSILSETSAEPPGFRLVLLGILAANAFVVVILGLRLRK